MYQAPVRSTTASTTRTVLAIVAILSLMLSALAIVRPVIAHAGGQDLPLANGTPGGTPADGEKEQDCSAAELLALQPGEAIFHFVLVGVDEGTELDAFEASFDTTGDATADVTYTLASPNVEVEERSSGNFSINVIVDADAVLISATAHISPTQVDPTKPKLNLSHTCVEGDVDGSLVI